MRKLESTRSYFTLGDKTDEDVKTISKIKKSSVYKKPGKYDHYLQNSLFELKVVSPGQLRGIQISFSKFKWHRNKNLEENGKGMRCFCCCVISSEQQILIPLIKSFL